MSIWDQVFTPGVYQVIILAAVFTFCIILIKVAPPGR